MLGLINTTQSKKNRLNAFGIKNKKRTWRICHIFIMIQNIL
jgi:hypothetical protein